MAKKTNRGLIDYAKAQLGLPYWYGTYGQTATKALYEYNKNRAETRGYYTADDYEQQFGKRVHDCSGLIKGYLWSETPTSEPFYNGKQDKCAADLYLTAEKRGTIKFMPETPGLLVFKQGNSARITHVGVYIGGGKVIEAKGHKYGVVETDFKTGGWSFWAQCIYLTPDVYYPAYSGKTQSIVDALNSLGVDSSMAHRRKIAALNDISPYTGTAEQNTKMLSMLKQGTLKRVNDD